MQIEKKDEMNMLSVSVVLSTYNGEEYIKKQLDSLYMQTYSPDKIYISDDHSTDSTVSIIKNYIEKHGINNWMISTNTNNYGWKKNFHLLLQQAKEDVVFLCDQDDIWNTDKIEIMLKILKSHPEAELIACGYQPFYEDSTKKVSRTITAQMIGKGTLDKIPFDPLFMNVLRPGCTFAVRRSLIESIEPYWDERIPHDAMIWRFAAIKGTGYILDQALISWRRYDNSSSNPHHNKSSEESESEIRFRNTINGIESHLAFYAKAIEFCTERGLDDNTLTILNKGKEFEQEYLEAIKSKSAIKVLQRGFKYRSHFLSRKTILADMLMAILVR